MKNALIWLGLPMLAALVLFLSLAFGSSEVGVRHMLGWLQGHADVQQQIIFAQLRLPRALAAMAIGGMLALVGVLLQALFRNPLADPALIGVSSSAAVGAALVVVAVPAGAWLLWLQPLLAFVAGLMALLLIYRFSRRLGQLDVARMLLLGVAINSMAGAVLILMMFVADDHQLRQVTFWSMGSLAQLNLNQAGLLLVVLSLVMLWALGLRRDLNVYLLGEAEARHLGLPVEAMKYQVLLLSGLATGLAVAFAGAIGFVGLVVPHMVRLIMGPDHRQLVPASLFAGAILLMLADLLARTVWSPMEFPIGVLTALIGAPLFFALLLGESRKGVL